MLSTSDLLLMPGIEALRAHMQCLAAISAVFSVEDDESPFTFDPRWDANEQMAASMNGSGDELYLHFVPHGCFIKGFAHESEMSPYANPEHSIWPGVVDQVPKEFESSLMEPAFDPEATTFVIWRLASSGEWLTGEVDFPDSEFGDGSRDLLAPISFSASDLSEWLSEQYETEVDSAIVQSVFEGRPLSDTQMTALNPEAPIRELRQAVRETGWKVETAG